MADAKLYITSDTQVYITGLYNESTSAYVSNATVSCAITNWADTAVGSAFSLTYVTSSNGNYQGTAPSSLSLSEGRVYTLTITVTSGSTTKTIRLKATAQYADG